MFMKQEYSLAPLSNLIAEIFDSAEHSKILDCLKMLGSHSIDNYGEDLIFKLYEKYSSAPFMSQMHNDNPKFFFEFSKAWPQFLKNNAILN